MLAAEASAPARVAGLLSPEPADFRLQLAVSSLGLQASFPLLQPAFPLLLEGGDVLFGLGVDPVQFSLVPFEYQVQDGAVAPGPAVGQGVDADGLVPVSGEPVPASAGFLSVGFSLKRQYSGMPSAA